MQQNDQKWIPHILRGEKGRIIYLAGSNDISVFMTKTKARILKGARGRVIKDFALDYRRSDEQLENDALAMSVTWLKNMARDLRTAAESIEKMTNAQ